METHPALRPFLDKLIVGDALEVLAQLLTESIDAVITDPPYFLDRLDNEWHPEKIKHKVYQLLAHRHAGSIWGNVLIFRLKVSKEGAFEESMVRAWWGPLRFALRQEGCFGSKPMKKPSKLLPRQEMIGFRDKVRSREERVRERPPLGQAALRSILVRPRCPFLR